MTWFTDEDLEKAARAAFNAEIEMWDAGSISIDWDSMEIDDKFPYLVAARAALTAVNPYEWRPIETVPHHVEVDFYREDAGVFSGEYTCCEPWLTDVEREALTEDERLSDDFWAFGPYGTDRLEGDERPTCWRHKALPPAPEGDK